MSQAYDWVVVTKVTLVQPTYMPNVVSFQIHETAGACNAGTWMRWDARGTTEGEKIANANAVYGSLMTAMIAGKTVRLYGVDANCAIDFIHMY